MHRLPAASEDSVESTSMSSMKQQLALVAIIAAFLVSCRVSDPLEQARDLQSQGLLEQSLEPLRERLASHPDDAEAHYRHGVALRHTGRPNAAVWSLRKASEHAAWKVAAGLELSAAAAEGRNWTLSIEAATAVLEAEPDNLAALYLRGEARLSDRQEPELTLADFDRALELDPDNIQIQLSRLAALLESNDVEQSAATLSRIQELGQEAALDEDTAGRLCVMQATFASESARLEEAEKLFGDCLERHPTHGVVLKEAMDFFDAHGRSDDANEFLRAALEREPRVLVYRQALAGRLSAEGRHDEAEALLRSGLELENGALRAGTWAALATHFEALNDLTAAADAYEHSLELVSQPMPGEILTLADLLARAGLHERALEVGKDLESDIYRGIIEARVHLDQHRPRQALDRFEEILLRWPNNAGARYYAGRAAEQIGDFDRAIEEYRQAMRSEAGLTDAGLRLARFYSAEGSGEHAWHAAFNHYKAHPDDPEGVSYIVSLAGRLGPESRLRSLLLDLRNTGMWGRAVAVRAETLAATRTSRDPATHRRSGCWSGTCSNSGRSAKPRPRFRPRSRLTPTRRRSMRFALCCWRVARHRPRRCEPPTSARWSWMPTTHSHSRGSRTWRHKPAMPRPPSHCTSG
jgi:tetratricopeptide (TPR) repeat protein